MPKQFITIISGVIVVVAVVAVGVLKSVGLLDGDTANTAVSLLIGLLAGGGIVSAGRKPRG